MKEIRQRLMAALAAALGISGVAMIALSFILNDGPPPGLPASQLLAFAATHHTSIVAGAWLQAVGTVTLCTFAVMLVSPPLAPPGAGVGVVVLGLSPLVTVGLLEVALYLAAANAETIELGQLSLAMIRATQHLYFIIAAPAAFIPLGFVLARSTPLPRALAVTALMFGVLFFVVGLTTLTEAELPARVTVLGSVQAVWWLSAAVAVYRAGRRGTVDLKEALTSY